MSSWAVIWVACPWLLGQTPPGSPPCQPLPSPSFLGLRSVGHSRKGFPRLPWAGPRVTCPARRPLRKEGSLSAHPITGGEAITYLVPGASPTAARSASTAPGSTPALGPGDPELLPRGLRARGQGPAWRVGRALTSGLPPGDGPRPWGKV